MINFFRKIRHQLANENKFWKYSRYAIGEIVLVVLGILIALQINNWNEDRKERVKEKEILFTLKNDLKTNIDILYSDISRLEYNMRACDSLVDVITFKKPMTDSLPYYFHTARFYANKKMSFSAYEALKSIGFDVIINNTLRSEIMKLYEVTYADMIGNIDNIYESSGAFIGQYYMSNFESIWDLSFPNNYEKIITDPIYKNVVQQLKTRHRWSRDLKKECVVESEKLIQSIDEELGQM